MDQPGVNPVNNTMKKRKKILFGTASMFALTVMAGLVMAPVFDAHAKNLPLFAWGKQHTTEQIDQPAAVPESKQPVPHRDRTAPEPESQRNDAAPTEQSQGEDHRRNFDGPTTFAANEIDGHYGAEGDRPHDHEFASTPGRGISGAAGAGKKHKKSSGDTTGDGQGSPGTPADDGKTGGDKDVGAPQDGPGGDKPKPVADVTEPTSIALLAIGLIGLLIARRRPDSTQ